MKNLITLIVFFSSLACFSQNISFTSNFFLPVQSKYSENISFNFTTNETGDLLLVSTQPNFNFSNTYLLFYDEITGEAYKTVYSSERTKSANYINFTQLGLKNYLNGKYTFSILQENKKIFQQKNINSLDFKKNSNSNSADIVVSLNDNLKTNSDFGRVDGIVSLGEKVKISISIKLSSISTTDKYWVQITQPGVKITKDSFFTKPTLGLNIDSAIVSTPLYYPKYEKRFLLRFFHKDLNNGEFDSTDFYIYYDVPFLKINDTKNSRSEYQSESLVLFTDKNYKIELIDGKKIRTQFIGDSKEFKHRAFFYLVDYNDTIDIIDQRTSNYELKSVAQSPTRLEGFYGMSERYGTRKSLGIMAKPMVFGVNMQSLIPLGLYVGMGKRSGFSAYFLLNGLKKYKADFNATDSKIMDDLDFINYSYKPTDTYKYNLLEIGAFRTIRIKPSIELGVGLVYTNYNFFNIIEQTNLNNSLVEDKIVRMNNLSYNQVIPSAVLNLNISKNIRLGFNTGLINQTKIKAFINTNLSYEF